MAFTLIFISIGAILLISQGVNCQINEPQEYAATAVPRNPSSVRQALGYNKYDGHNVKDSDKSISYGNNWELYDQGNQDNQGQNQYNQGQNQYYGNQAQQPYRYYRAIYY